MMDTEFLKNLGKFNLIVKKRITSNYKGGRRSLAHGRGISLMDFRQYVPGDDIRTVDWKIFGRTDDLYIKRFEEERSLAVHIVVDQSASMNFGGKKTKFDYSSMIGVGFAYLTMKENERFEFSTFAEDLNTIRARKGPHQLAYIVEYLNKAKVKGDSKFEQIMSKYKRMITSRSLIIVISDFLFDLQEIEKGLACIGRRGKHDIKVIQVLDKVESELDIEGDVQLHDAESGNTLRTHISPRLRKRYQYELNRHSDKIHDMCRRLGLHYYFVTTDIPIFDAFFEILR